MSELSAGQRLPSSRDLAQRCSRCPAIRSLPPTTHWSRRAISRPASAAEFSLAARPKLSSRTDTRRWYRVERTSRHAPGPYTRFRGPAPFRPSQPDVRLFPIRMWNRAAGAASPPRQRNSQLSVSVLIGTRQPCARLWRTTCATAAGFAATGARSPSLPARSRRCFCWPTCSSILATASTWKTPDTWARASRSARPARASFPSPSMTRAFACRVPTAGRCRSFT